MVKQVMAKFGGILDVSYNGFEEPHYAPGDDPLVQTCSVYEKQTGTRPRSRYRRRYLRPPLQARGCLRRPAGKRPDGHARANEYMMVKDLIDSIAIYAEAI